jgi:chromatin remodeling complex protein RSC6
LSINEGKKSEKQMEKGEGNRKKKEREGKKSGKKTEKVKEEKKTRKSSATTDINISDNVFLLIMIRNLPLPFSVLLPFSRPRRHLNSLTV